MRTGDIIKYLRRMSLSILMMLLLTYGMATGNPWLQPLYVVLLVIALQFGYQIFQSIRTRSIVEANMKDASRAKRGSILFEATERAVNDAKGEGVEEMSMGKRMLIISFVPLAIYVASGYVLSIFIPEIQPWQSYLIGFLLSMPISTVLTYKMGAMPGMTLVTPNSYVVSERGIVFTHINQSFVLRFPLSKLNVQKEKNFIEVEGKAEATVIPNNLRLFSGRRRMAQLESILMKRLVSSDAKR